MSSTKEIRLQFGITQQHLANFLNVSTATISMAEAYYRDLPYAALKKLTNFFVLLPATPAAQKTTYSKSQAQHRQAFDKQLAKQIGNIQYKIRGLSMQLAALKAIYLTAEQKLKLVNTPEAIAMAGIDAILISLWEIDATNAIKKSHMGIQALMQIEIDTLGQQLAALIKLQDKPAIIL